MRPLQSVKTHAHHTISFETIERIDWHLRHLPDLGWTVIKEMNAKKHRKLHAKRRKGKPVKFFNAVLGYQRGVG
jgi:hypothetical protein